MNAQTARNLSARPMTTETESNGSRYFWTGTTYLIMQTYDQYLINCLNRIDELRQRWGPGYYNPLVPSRYAPDLVRDLQERGFEVEIRRVTDVSVILRIKYGC